MKHINCNAVIRIFSYFTTMKILSSTEMILIWFLLLHILSSISSFPQFNSLGFDSGEYNFLLSRKSHWYIDWDLFAEYANWNNRIEFRGNLRKIGWKVPKFDIKKWKKGFFCYFYNKVGMQIGKFEKKWSTLDWE